MPLVHSHTVSLAYKYMWCRADSRFAPSQWETALLCNDVSHWLGASLESSLWCRVLSKCLHPGLPQDILALCHCSGSAGASVVAHSVALPLYRDCFLDLRLFNSPDLRRVGLCYCCQAWTLETVLGGNTALTRWWTARSIDADAKR